jgi:hypothetical protein
MPEWLTDTIPSDYQAHLPTLTLRLVLALVLGGATALLYYATHRRDETLTRSFLTTLVLLSVLIAMVTQVIGDSVARAFSLVGALSIVRFRTVVEDTRDTAFVILSVVVGMAIGAGHLEVALIGLGVVGIAAAVMSWRRPRNAAGVMPHWSLSVRIGITYTPEELFRQVFRTHVVASRLTAVATSKQGQAMDLTYRIRLRPSSLPTVLLAELNRLEGVQSVELRGS